MYVSTRQGVNFVDNTQLIICFIKSLTIGIIIIFHFIWFTGFCFTSAPNNRLLTKYGRGHARDSVFCSRTIGA